MADSLVFSSALLAQLSTSISASPEPLQTTLAFNPVRGDSSTAIATTQFVTELLGPGSLTGSIVMWVGNVSPSGYVFCDGSSYSTQQYKALYNIIGYEYGGDTDTFCVPNMTGMFPIGASTRTPYPVSNILGTDLKTGGSSTISIEQMPTHTHDYDVAFTNTGAAGGSTAAKTQGLSTTSSSGLNNPYAPPFFAVNFIIKF